ncbi:MAG: hypothetical protein NVS3B10_02530 [Polyangiales bacterium]
MTVRRFFLLCATLAFAALSARRAHANRDPSELSVGGGLGAHDAHLGCGPDVRVKHASAGFTYERTFESPGRPAGEGPLFQLRGGGGTSTITQVNGAGIACGSGTTSTSECNTEANRLYANESGVTHTLASMQAGGGFDWGRIALAGGLGYFGLSQAVDEHSHFQSRYMPLPIVDLRVGRRRTGFSANFGAGSAPLPGFTRWYSLYAIGQYRFREGGEIGAGLIGVPAGELDARSGVLFKGAVPITDWLSVGGFGVVDANDRSSLTGVNWTAGGHMTFVLEEIDD